MARRRLGRAAGLLALASWGAACVPAAAAVVSASPGGSGAWTVYHGDPAGTGVAGPVRAVDTAAPAWTSPTLDGQLYGEPLVFGGQVYVATEDDSVYALSAATGAVVWRTHLASPVPSTALPCGDIAPTVGITGTPVIDPARREIFVVADEWVSGSPVKELVGLSTGSGRVEMTQGVDPPGADPANQLQRTGLTLDAGQVVFGMAGNYGDCSTFKGRVVAVPEGGGTPRFFTFDAAAGENLGGVWQGGAAPVVDGSGDIWVATANGSVYSYAEAYDYGVGMLELSSSLRLLQFFAPSTWAEDNAQDLDMSTAPVLLPDGQVILAGKSRIVYLLNGAHLGGIGHPQATLGAVAGSLVGSACSYNIDGGAAEVGMTVYLPCLSGIIAVRATRSPPALTLLWSSGTGGGPPIVAGGLVWTQGQNGILYGLVPATGKIRQQVTVGTPANHFPTPSVGDGLLLATAARDVVAFAAPASGAAAATPTPTATRGPSPSPSPSPAGRPGLSASGAASIAVGILLILAGTGWVLYRRRAGGSR
jgi:outer membrane protein assembly factor BamB